MDDIFFIVSKLVWGLLSPICLFVWLVLLSTILLWLNYFAAAKKLLLSLSIAAFFIMAYPVSDWMMYPLETRFTVPQELPKEIDGIIVLGGAEQLKIAENWDTPALGQSAERILAAAELSRVYLDAPVLYTGGSNHIQFESKDNKGGLATRLLTQAGVGASRIVIEPNARNTYENFVFIKPYLPKQNGRYLLITSAFHMPRSVGSAQQQKIEVIPYPVDFRSSRENYRYWDFDLFEHIDILETAWHEWIGLSVYFITGKTANWLPGMQSE